MIDNKEIYRYDDVGQKNEEILLSSRKKTMTKIQRIYLKNMADLFNELKEEMNLSIMNL